MLFRCSGRAGSERKGRSVNGSIYEEGVSMSARLPCIVRGFARRTAISALAMSCSLACAGNLNFLKDTPITYMRPADRQALNRAAQEALDTKKDGESLKWSNAGTGNTVHIEGTVTPRDTAKSGSETCRKVTLVAVAKGQTQSWTPTACRKGGGQWKIKRQ
jgi:surface antigen